MLPETLRHGRVVDALDDRLAQAAVLREVVHQQAGHLELVDEGSALVGCSRAVGVAVQQEAQVEPATGEHAQCLVDVRANGLRVDAAEIRVPLLVDLRYPDLSASEQARKPSGTRSPHGLHQDVHVRGANGVQVDRPSQEPLVARVRIVALDHARLLGVRERAPLDCPAAVLGDRRLEHFQDVRTGRGSGG